MAEAQKWDLPIEKSKRTYGKAWNVDNMTWYTVTDKWLKGSDDNPLLLVPKQILSHKYPYKVQDYLNHQVLVWRQNYHYDENTEFYRNAKLNKAKRPTKKSIKEFELNSEKYKDNKQKSYSLEMTLENPNLINTYLNN